VFSSAAALFGVSTGYRLKTSNAWGSWLTCTAEITGQTVAEEWDEERRTTVKRQRASVKIFDTTTADAPALRLGDEIRQDSIVWTVSGRSFAAQAAGVYRYALMREVHLKAQPDRQHMPIAEGGTAAASGDTMPLFTATNVEASAAIFFGAMVQRTSTGVVLARADVLGKDAVGICTVAAAATETASYITEGAFTTSDWTAIIGTTLLTPGALYFLDRAAGKLTTTVPSSPTSVYSQPIGTAMSTTTLDLEIVEPILL
jgi:hypothetical protein